MLTLSITVLYFEKKVAKKIFINISVAHHNYLTQSMKVDVCLLSHLHFCGFIQDVPKEHHKITK